MNYSTINATISFGNTNLMNVQCDGLIDIKFAIQYFLSPLDLKIAF